LQTLEWCLEKDEYDNFFIRISTGRDSQDVPEVLPVSYIVSWSGGKDSCLAGYLAMKQGYSISHLMNFIAGESRRVQFHGSEARLVQLQSQALDIPLVQKETTLDGYEREFKQAVQSLIPAGVKGMIFGDIFLLGHENWAERVCNEIGIESVEPLWGKNAEEILSNFINYGFKAIIVTARAELIGKEWIGRLVDKEFIEYIKNEGIDICGESGEYHTLVVDGPIFKKKIEIVQSEAIRRGDYWFLDTYSYRLVNNVRSPL